MITSSNDRPWPDAGKDAMEIDWSDPGIGAYVHAHPGHSAPFGSGCANLIFRIRPFTLRGAA
jgi:hypothetical protein